MVDQDLALLRQRQVWPIGDGLAHADETSFPAHVHGIEGQRLLRLLVILGSKEQETMLQSVDVRGKWLWGFSENEQALPFLKRGNGLAEGIVASRVMIDGDAWLMAEQRHEQWGEQTR